MRRSHIIKTALQLRHKMEFSQMNMLARRGGDTDSIRISNDDFEPVSVADLFCGAGGTSTGAEQALADLGKRMNLVCINHWHIAIETHLRNHPDARHICQNIEAVEPDKVVPDGRLGLLLASPTCTYHSRARNGKPTSDQMRMDPWHIVRWCTSLNIQRIFIENVPEYIEWGPVDPTTGKIIKERKGEYFRAWINALATIGMAVDWRIVNCANYGDGTTRKRFILIGRSDGKPLEWAPETHAPADKAASVGLKPWVAARDIIDWSIEGKSIFNRKKRLADNTLKRIYAGFRKYGGPQAEPFLVILRRHCDALPLDGPLPTITAKGNHIAIAVPELTPFVLGQHGGSAPREVGQPLPTITTDGAISLITPTLIHMKGRSDALSITNPFPTITTKSQLAVMEPSIQPMDDMNRDLFGPMDPQDLQDRIVEIDGKTYLLDIKFRMLEWHELARAMSFSDDFTSYHFVGNKTQIVKQIGNAVPVKTARAIITTLMAH